MVMVMRYFLDGSTKVEDDVYDSLMDAMEYKLCNLIMAKTWIQCGDLVSIPS
jgi:hypothetical protein